MAALCFNTLSESTASLLQAHSHRAALMNNKKENSDYRGFLSLLLLLTQLQHKFKLMRTHFQQHRLNCYWQGAKKSVLYPLSTENTKTRLQSWEWTASNLYTQYQKKAAADWTCPSCHTYTQHTVKEIIPLILMSIYSRSIRSWTCALQWWKSELENQLSSDQRPRL